MRTGERLNIICKFIHQSCFSGAGDRRPSRASFLTSVAAAIVLAAMLVPSVVGVACQGDDAVEATADAHEVQAASDSEGDGKGKVIGIKNVCVHVLKLDETLKLYQEILGFKHVKSVTLHGEGVEGMVVREMQAGDCLVHLSLPAPEYSHTVGPIGNTNHNHFMLLVDDIVPICDKLKAEGYELENENYAAEKWSFFTGPNGEIVGLTEWK